jgi:F0F1-type ATP synthase epsilon subunit
MRESLLFEGRVLSLTSSNDKGKFDILANHANFISIIKGFLIYRDTVGQEHNLKVDNGILRFRDNQAQIFLGLKH